MMKNTWRASEVKVSLPARIQEKAVTEKDIFSSTERVSKY
jgi:hypothetical protein